MKITIGKSGHDNLSLDLGVLQATRMLLTADSGGGKTFALKRIIEQAFGKIQIIVIDPEGEFSPLRERYNFVLCGPGGETPAHPAAAPLLAERLLKLHASCICDLSEMKPSERHLWVKNFLDGLIEAPKALRHAVLVIVDEAHIFCPEKGKGESLASESMIGLCTRGRKRGLIALFATQRLATLNKDASGMLANRLIGPTFEDTNRKRAAEILGVTREGLHDFFDQIKVLEPGYFFALGRALCTERKLVHIGPIQTPHGDEARKYATAPPPAPAEIAKLLPQLSDLPKEADDKAKTVNQLKADIRSLKAQLRAQPKQAATVTVIDSKAKDRALREQRAEFDAAFSEARRDLKRFKAAMVSIGDIARRELGKNVDWWPKIPGGEIQAKGNPVGSSVLRPKQPASIPTPIVHPRPDISSNGDFSRPQMRILQSLAQLEAIGQSAPSREQVAFWSGVRPTSGSYMNNLGALRSASKISYPSVGAVALTEEGRATVGDQAAPDESEVFRHILSMLSGPQKKILEQLKEKYPESINRDELAALCGVSSTSGSYMNNLGAMRTAGLLDYPDRGTVKAAQWLFFE